MRSLLKRLYLRPFHAVVADPVVADTMAADMMAADMMTVDAIDAAIVIALCEGLACYMVKISSFAIYC